MAKKNTQPRKQLPVSKDKAQYELLSYEITSDPIIDKEYQKLPRVIQDELEDICSQITPTLIFKKDSLVISRLEELVAQYPHQARIGNYLAMAYSMINSPKLQIFIAESYKKHPDYLFARIHYAEYCLRHNEIEKIKEVFEEGFDLKALYPHRNRFHISEYVGFNALMCHYYMMTDDRQLAELLLQAIEKVAPHHPVTRQARKIVKGTFFSRLKKKLGLTSDNRNKLASDVNKSSSFKA